MTDLQSLAEPAPTIAAEASSAPPAQRDAKGRYLPGNTVTHGIGRPRRPDLLTRAKAEADRTGIDIEAALGRVALKMIALAEAGDVGAAKLVLDRLTLGADEAGAGVQLTVITGVDDRGEIRQGIALRTSATAAQESDE